MADEEQVKLLKSGVEAWNKWREENPQAEARLSNAELNGAHLHGANLRQGNLRGANLRGIDLVRADLAEANLAIADLTETVLHDADLSGALLVKTNLRGAYGSGITAAKANLNGADLTGAILDGANFSGANLSFASMRNANLRNADFTGVQGFQAHQLGGALTSGATLPETVARFEMLKVIEKAAANARKIFLAMLLGCAYAVLTIATTTDARLLTNSATSPLPIIQAQIPIVGFYLAAPLILLGFYLYFHFCLQNIWERLATLPAELPDGRTVDKAADPWLLLGLVQAHFARLRPNRTFFSRFQHVVSIFLAWWSVPLTLFLLWGRYLRRHEALVTSWQIALLLAAAVIGVYSYRRAVATLRGGDDPGFWKRKQGAAVFGAIALFWVLGTGVNGAINDWRWGDGVFLRVQDWLLTADITDADVSTKPQSWSGDGDGQMGLVRPARARGTNLSRVRGDRAFLVRADLIGADMRKANLRGADLREANLIWADLAGADLSGADLRRANFSAGQLTLTFLAASAIGIDESEFDQIPVPVGGTMLRVAGADLTGAILTEADLEGANLSGVSLIRAVGLTQDQLSAACADRHLVLPEGLEQPPPCAEGEAEVEAN